MTDESVLGISEAHFRLCGAFRGFHAANADERAALLDPAAFEFRPRSQCETDPTFKQLIPYVLLKHGSTLFHYRRGGSGTETRLRALRSLGIGGHISEADAAGGADPYRTGMHREIAEEVAIGGDYSERFLGFIHDDSTPVGSVHLGVVHLFELTRADVRSREDALADGGFAQIDTLRWQMEEFESWSRLALEAMVAIPG